MLCRVRSTIGPYDRIVDPETQLLEKTGQFRNRSPDSLLSIGDKAVPDKAVPHTASPPNDNRECGYLSPSSSSSAGAMSLHSKT